MINWIMDKLNLMRFRIRPLRIRSYTDIVKERIFDDIDKFRSNVFNMDMGDIENGIKLIGDMKLDCGIHREAFDDFQEIKTRFYMMQTGAFDPSNPLGPFGGIYAQYAQDCQYSHYSQFWNQP